MLIIGLGLYLLDFILWNNFHSWIIQLFTPYVLINLFTQGKKKTKNNNWSFYILLFLWQTSVRYGNFTIAAATTTTLFILIFFAKNQLESSNSSYPFLFLFGLFAFEYGFVKPIILQKATSLYFTGSSFCISMIAMSLIMGMRGNR